MRWLYSLLLLSNVGFALVGGQKAAPDQFPAVALLEDCTTSKIGEFHFLLAGHCVVNGAGRGDDDAYLNQTLPAFAEGSEIRLDRDVSHRKGHWTDVLHVARTFVHPAYRYSSVGHAWLKPQGISDIAVIVVKEKTPEIPVLAFLTERLTVGEEILKLGYGCPETTAKKIKEWVADGDRELKFAASRVRAGVDSLRAYHDAAKKSAKALAYYSTSALRDFIAGSFTVTPGKFHAAPPKKDSDAGDAGEASLGFSDSGGPVLVKRRGKYAVVGVNAKSLLWPREEHGTLLEPVAFDLHTRVDAESFTGTAEWLKQVLAVTAAKAKGAPLDGLLTGVVSGKAESLVTRAYLRPEVEKLTLTLSSPAGGPCPRSLEKVELYDLNREDRLVWAAKPDEKNDEVALKAASPGRFVLTPDDAVKIESARLTLSGGKAPGSDAVCLFRLE